MKGITAFIFAATLLSLSQQSSASITINETDAKSFSVTKSVRDNTPLSDYKYIAPYGYYKFVATSKNFLNSILDCQNHGAKLAVLTSAVEAEEIVKYFRPKLSNDAETVRIGFGDFFGKGTLFTVNGKQLINTGYSNWKVGQPTTEYERNCGWMNAEKQMGTGCCDCKKKFLCEFK